jgi:hypothetical protein
VSTADGVTAANWTDTSTAVNHINGRPQAQHPHAADVHLLHRPRGRRPGRPHACGRTTDTRRGWNGKVIDDVIDGDRSLKSRGERLGPVCRSVPHTVRLQPGHRYRVSFRYENQSADQYAWLTAVDTPAPSS